MFAKTIDSLWEIDLVDVQSIKGFNRGFRYILTCIDVLSKILWAIPLKDKKGSTLVQAFKVILKSGRKPVKIHSDQGTEFTNRLFQSLLKERNVGFYVTFNDTKASIVERARYTTQKHFILCIVSAFE